MYNMRTLICYQDFSYLVSELLYTTDLSLLPRSVMLARYMLWPCVCLSVRHKAEFYQKG